MLHTRNSIKGIFILENNGIPINLVTDFSEPIKNGSLCIDTLNDDLYILKDNNWIIVGSDVNKVSYISFIELQNIINNNELLIGSIYILDFETIHIIPKTTDINVGLTEQLLLTPVSTNKLNINAKSLQHPSDIIHYDFNDNITEDGITPRKGKITYRKDTILRLETWYDWRNVKFRRWGIDSTTNNTQWTTNNTQYSYNDVVYDSGFIFKCLKDHISLNQNTPNNDSDRWLKILNTSFPRQHYSWNENVINIGGVGIVSNTQFIDVLTFDLSGTTSMDNITIKKCDEIYNNGYNNITFSDILGTQKKTSDIIFEENCRDIMINSEGFCSNKIGNDCSDILFNTGFSDNIIGSGCTNITLGSNITQSIISNGSGNIAIGDGLYRGIFSINNSQIDINKNCSYIYLEDNVSGILIGENCDNIKIGSFTNSVRIIDNNNNNILVGTNSSDIEILDSGNIDIIIGSNCNNINFSGGNNSKNTIGDNSSNITYIGGSSDNIIGSNCNNISFNGGSNNFNIINHNCNNITLNGANDSNNFIGNNEDITLAGASSFNSFGNYINDLSINFQLNNVNILVNNTGNLATTIPYNNIVVDMLSPDNTLWFKEIDNLGSIITNKFE